MSAFSAWVSEAVYAVSGIRSKQPCDFRRKRVLTCVQSGVVACQELVPAVAYARIDRMVLRSASVSANQVIQFKKPG